MKNDQKIIPFLWFNNNAEEAVKFYISVFKKDCRILSVARRPKNVPGPKGSVMLIAFLLNGQKFLAMNGGAGVKFNQAISLVVHCKNQKEIDSFWEKLSKGGKKNVCGWLQDKYGLSWQVCPEQIKTLLSGSPEQTRRVMAAVMSMTKLNLAEMQKAYKGPAPR